MQEIGYLVIYSLLWLFIRYSEFHAYICVCVFYTGVFIIIIIYYYYYYYYYYCNVLCGKYIINNKIIQYFNYLNDFVRFLRWTNFVGDAFEHLSASPKICQVTTNHPPL